MLFQSLQDVVVMWSIIHELKGSASIKSTYFYTTPRFEYFAKCIIELDVYECT